MSRGATDVQVQNPAGIYVYSALFEENKYQNLISINTAENGVYAFCFDNTMSLYTPKLIDFAIKSGTATPATRDEVSTLETKLTQIESYLKDAQSSQKRFRNRERRNRRSLGPCN